jgi:hypothetical protein
MVLFSMHNRALYPYLLQRQDTALRWRRAVWVFKGVGRANPLEYVGRWAAEAKAFGPGCGGDAFVLWLRCAASVL